MKLSRQMKYYYIRFIRLRGEPHELALGIAFGIFAGMMPIMPFQTALALMLALFFKGSKISAALGTWISNPMDWYFIYYYSYKLGLWVLNLQERKALFSTVMEAIRSGKEPMVIAQKILGAGSAFVGAFLIGGIALGLVFAPLSYFISLYIFKRLRTWRRSRKRRKY